jgi:hypothetical protein
MDAHDGFVGWVAASTDCYAALAANDIEQRVYCLQLDRAEYEIERNSPQAFQDADAVSNDYFTDARFIERQLSNAPIAADVEGDLSTKKDELVMLERAMAIAIEEYLRRPGANAASQAAAPPALCKISACKT